MSLEERVRQELVHGCQRLYGRNMLAAADGNLSFRLSDDRILITPSGVAKAFLSASEMAVMNLDGEVLQGSPSGERLMHLEVYRRCDKAKAVVHAHPPTAIAWSVARPELKELPNEALSEVILAAGSIPIVPYSRPSTQAMGDSLRPFLPQSRLMILSRHGGLSWGESLDEALGGMERLEHVAHILWLAEGLGGLTSLPPQEVEALWQMRRQMGDKTL